MEVSGLCAANSVQRHGMRKVKSLLDSLANNEEDRMNLLEAQLTLNPFDFDIEMSNTKSVNVNIINAFLYCMQRKLID